MTWWPDTIRCSGGCFTNVSRALQKILSKFVYCTNSTGDENFKLKLCMCAQSLALGTRTNFQIEILTINVISGVVYVRENILGSSRNVSETAPRHLQALWCQIHRVISLMFQKLSKIISRKYTMPEITFIVRISIWNFVDVPKASFWAHRTRTKFELEFS